MLVKDHCRLVLRLGSRLVAAAAGLAIALCAGEASAQQKTFKLDRLEMPGAPDDGAILFRPVTNQRTIVYGQLGIGYQLEPLHTRNITVDPDTIRRSSSSVITHEMNVYMNAGFEVFDRFIVGVAFPWGVNSGKNPDYGTTNLLGSSRTTVVTTDSAFAGDVRLDLRGTIWRSFDRRTAIGGGLHLFAPSGSQTNFGGDGDTGGLIMVDAEHTVKGITLIANTGIAFRPHNSINDPVSKAGLGVGDEWRWAVGAMIPFKDGKYRFGATIFGSTGIEDDTGSTNAVIGNTVFTKRNSPVEFDIDGTHAIWSRRSVLGGLGARLRDHQSRVRRTRPSRRCARGHLHSDSRL